MGNEIVKNEKQKQVALYTNQKAFIQELETTASGTGAKFSEYGVKCMVNAYASLLTICNQQNIQFNQFDGALLRSAFQNVGYTELNFAANECYFDIRKNYKEEGGKKVLTGYSIAIKPQGAGNEKLLRKYGVNVEKVYPCWLVREGDRFILPSFNGIKMSDPVWERDINNLNNKVIMVVYPVKIKGEDRVEYLMATRESVKSNLVAHIRQNMLYKVYGAEKDKKYDELDADAEKMSLEELLASPTWRDWINPNWLSSSSKESMIIRKMQNNALKNYPKEYDSNAVKEAVKSMIEDYDESLDQKAKAFIEVDAVDKVEKEIHEEPQADAVPNFDVDENGEVEEKVETKEEVKEEPKQKAEPKVEQVKPDLDEDYGF